MEFDQTIALHFDGPDGAGKSSLCRLLRGIFPPHRYEDMAFPTEVPNGPFSDELEEARYYLSDFQRAFKRLSDDKPEFLLLDRSFVSTLAYQGLQVTGKSVEDQFCNGHSVADVILEEGRDLYRDHFGDDVIPVFFILFDDPATLNSRIGGRADEISRMAERERLSRLSDLNRCYEEASERIGGEAEVRKLTNGSLDFYLAEVVETIMSLVPNALRDGGR